LLPRAPKPTMPSADVQLDMQRAFVIEDDRAIFQFFATTLAESGLTAENFQTAAPALTALANSRPAIIFLDIALLQSDAIDVLIGLGERRYQGVVHLMSGGRQQLLDAVRRLGLRHGVRLAPPLNKPVSRDAILGAVAALRRPETAAGATPAMTRGGTKADGSDGPAGNGNGELAPADVDAPPPEGGRLSSTWLICRSSEQLHALPLEDVTEIMRPLPIEPIAGAPGYVRGASIVRGEVVPVVDCGLLVANKATQPGRMVSLKVGTRKVGLLVEQVAGIRNFAGGELTALPPLLRHVARETVSAVGSLDAAFLVSLQTARLVPEDVRRNLEARKST
jgi:purine-binding chemotaxis protein CheW